MNKWPLITLATLFLFLVKPTAVSAVEDPKINEFLPDPNSGGKEWVEIYNPDKIDLSTYYLKDASGSEKLLTNLQSCDVYYVWEYESGDGWLNNTGTESITLFSPSDATIDSHADWTSPSEDKTLGRSPDKTGSFQQLESATKCAQNSSPAPTPTPTPTTAPASTPSPASTPTPTKKSPTPTPKGTVLSQSTSSATPTPTPNGSSALDTDSGSRTKFAFIITGAGIILIGLSAAFYFFYRRLDQDKETDEKEKTNQD